MAEQSQLFYRYHFTFEDNKKVVLEVNLDPETLKYIPSSTQETPEWARFDYLPCEQCVEQNKETECCPVAANIAEVVVAFKDVYSYERVDVIVETNERVYFGEKVSIQQAMSSIVGIIMVTSGCEDLDKLKPMVRFHLPFSTTEETIYRAASMYLLAQYIRGKHGMSSDWEMNELTRIYQKIEQINTNLCKRLEMASRKDASLNAIIILDTYAKSVPMSIEETLADLEHLFSIYLS